MILMRAIKKPAFPINLNTMLSFLAERLNYYAKIKKTKNIVVFNNKSPETTGPDHCIIGCVIRKTTIKC